MSSGEFKWVEVNPSESKWVQVNPSGSKWIQVDPSESKWVQVNLSESEWIQVNPSESKWIQVSPSESKWIQVHPSEFKRIQRNPSESKWSPLPPNPPIQLLMALSVYGCTFTISNNSWTNVGGWGEWAQLGSRFVSFVHAYARSGSEVGIGKNCAGPSPFPFPFWLRRVFLSSFVQF